ncbi:hypothetical protein GLOTRDRAFT_116239 [Gloeophyllum trabeum ATCC 11539]|uniref:Uncharacterized protein n=1 Tax=Gloeophyllum trabeum (strain ATCC 11539 / FP-39264 / Madison 617) TaxID=670483 RepID=S7Q6Z9_GLOTA|nr:uncharacterized protein GLOTRDRAFT_116239 [Gloeophyllum trabeum ATCC 11539]EPQ55297.1 hypothetical protein GLOTRDRAFT_116239 [Gloeophyllum trabeum ATCC 11539]
MDTAPSEIFMSIVSYPGTGERSFEELRVTDYIHAYSTTGAAPVPCDPLPAAPDRAALGLSPAFAPAVITPDVEAELFLLQIDPTLPPSEQPILIDHPMDGSPSSSAACKRERSDAFTSASATPPLPIPTYISDPVPRGTVLAEGNGRVVRALPVRRRAVGQAA